MTPVEKLEAAIAKLTASQAGIDIDGDWLIEYTNEHDCGGYGEASSWTHEPSCGIVPLTNDAEEVTRYRTVDAQLGILHLAVEYGQLESGNGSRFSSAAVVLATAILGGA